MDKIKVRDINAADKDNLIRVISSINIFSDEDKRISLELIDEYLEDKENDDYWVRLAQSGNEVAGFICFGPASLCTGTYDIYYIAVDPKHRRKGIGKYLVECVLHELHEKKARMLLIETTSDIRYEGTLRFYENLGFVEIERIKDYYKDGEDRIIYQKRF